MPNKTERANSQLSLDGERRTFLIADTTGKGEAPTFGRGSAMRPDGELSDAHASVATSPREHEVVLGGIDAAIERSGGKVTPDNAAAVLADAAQTGGIDVSVQPGRPEAQVSASPEMPRPK